MQRLGMPGSALGKKGLTNNRFHPSKMEKKKKSMKHCKIIITWEWCANDNV